MYYITEEELFIPYFRLGLWSYYSKEGYKERFLKLNPNVSIRKVSIRERGVKKKESINQLASRMAKQLNLEKKELQMYFGALAKKI